jgi:hypothetical protein
MALNKEDIMALISILQKGLEDNENLDEKKEETKPAKKTRQKKSSQTVDSSFNMKTRGRSKVKSTEAYENNFDKMQEFAFHKEDTEIDQKLSKHPPVARTRENIEPIKVTCRVCGRKDKVNPGLVLEGLLRYKCNKCSTQAG